MDFKTCCKKMFQSFEISSKKGDPFQMNFIQNVDDVYSKMVRLFKIIFIMIHHNFFAKSYKKNSDESNIC